uniref:Uncharacterized protein n=1 Tax=Romanomermis culicivorax TaxID=13658 RepID=A0A915L6Y6_ROMCU
MQVTVKQDVAKNITEKYDVNHVMLGEIGRHVNLLNMISEASKPAKKLNFLRKSPNNVEELSLKWIVATEKNHPVWLTKTGESSYKHLKNRL